MGNSNLILNCGQYWDRITHTNSQTTIYYTLDVFIRRLELVTFNKNIIIYIYDWSYYPRAKAGDPLGDESLTGLNYRSTRRVTVGRQTSNRFPCIHIYNIILYILFTYILYNIYYIGVSILYIYIYSYIYIYNIYHVNANGKSGGNYPQQYFLGFVHFIFFFIEIFENSFIYSFWHWLNINSISMDGNELFKRTMNESKITVKYKLQYR